ncbi:MAG: DUF1549 domain-containing protein, partial [Rhizobiales bacterium]|nr:DUF1549 domain-containing protein [Hyphomicrobiales bacterium]
MRLDPNALAISLALIGFFAYAADQVKKPGIAPARKVAVAKPTIKAVGGKAVVNLAANKPKMPIVPSMAKRPKLWSLQPLVRPAVPAARVDNTNPIDAFVQAIYASKKVTPVGTADQRTLLRRVYMDLIGIPPTPAEQDEYLSDKSPDAYEKLI